MNEIERRAELVAATITAGSQFSIDTARIGGIDLPVYANAPRTVRDVLVTGAQWGERRAITYEDESYTWAEYTDLVARFATVLVERYGVGKGDRVAIAMRNYPEWIVTFAAAVGIGAVCVPLNAWWTGGELVGALGDCGATVLVADRERAESVRSRRSELPDLRGVVEVRPGATVHGDDEWAALLASEPAAIDLTSVPIDPDDDATIMYTSGTTGRPNGAVATHRAHITTMMNMRWHALVEGQMAHWRGDPPQRPPERPTTLVPGPLFHVAYLPRVISAAVTGVHLVLMYRWDARRAVELIEREHVDGLVGVPTVTRQLMDEIERSGAQVSSLRSLGTGAAQATSALVERIGTLFRQRVTTATGYGLTETCGPMVMIGSYDYFRRPLAVGRPFPTAQVRVVGEDGDVGVGEIGEAWFKGANVARGYWSGDTGAFTADGWFRTGDLVRRDADGFVYIVDRIKDIVIRGGENVYCGEVEERLGEHPAVEEIAVLGVPHQQLGEEVVAVVQVKPGATVTAEELRDHARLHLAEFKIPARLFISADGLPRNAAGKVLKRELRERIDGSALSRRDHS